MDNVTELMNPDSDPLQNKDLVESFSQIKQETRILREIMDIQDELSIVNSYLSFKRLL